MRIRKTWECIVNERLAICALVLQILWLYLIFGLICGFTSCTTSHKASKYMVKHPVVGATYCEVYHPCKDSVSVLTKYMEGEVRIDTIDNSHVDTFTSHTTKIQYVVRYKTITRIKTDTVTSIRTIYQTDKACVELLRNAKEMIVAKDKQLHQRTRIAFWLALSWLLFILGWLVRSLIFNRLNRG